MLITFKRTYTSQIFDIQIDPSWSITQFISISKNYLSILTSLDINNIQIIDIDLDRQEDADELENSEEIFSSRYLNYQPCFYFRYKMIQVPSLENCPVCLDNPRQMLQTSCNHEICSRCYNHLAVISHRSCPLCRAYVII
jgi:hypothetical protein